MSLREQGQEAGVTEVVEVLVRERRLAVVALGPFLERHAELGGDADELPLTVGTGIERPSHGRDASRSTRDRLEPNDLGART